MTQMEIQYKSFQSMVNCKVQNLMQIARHDPRMKNATVGHACDYLLDTGVVTSEQIIAAVELGERN